MYKILAVKGENFYITVVHRCVKIVLKNHDNYVTRQPNQSSVCDDP